LFSKKTEKMATKEKNTALPIEIVRYSDRPKPKLTDAQREQVIEALVASTKRAMGRKFRERLFGG